MSRVQLSINVTDLDAAVAFYSRLFGTEPAKPGQRAWEYYTVLEHVETP
jgi:predicted enzyme related to lactoylglutathione lyase